jgi:lysophospholipase L1-like esterase
MFRFVTVALALAAVAGCELSLRVIGVGDDYDLVSPVPGTPPALPWRFNPDVDRVYFGSRDMLGPEPRRFAIPRPDNVLRIVFLGESTVNGFPYATEVVFPRQVEHLLEAQRPGTDVEILNAGITAINSFEIADLAARCAACQPDLVVIHAGHNEFFGPGGPGSSVLPLPPALVRMTFFVRRLRLGQLAGRLVPEQGGDGRHPLEAFPRLTSIRLEDAEFRQATENFRANLHTAVNELQSEGIPVLLTTVASNLRDQGPIRNLWPHGWTTAEQAAAAATIARAATSAEAGDAAAGLALLDAMPPDARETALWQYRRGQMLLAQERPALAREAFVKARDLDGCRFRAPSVFGTIVREIADGARQGVALLDTEAVVAAASEQGVPGRDLFLEHVHYNLRGHRLLARAIAKAIHTGPLAGSWAPARDLDDPALDERLGLLDEDALAGASFALEAVETPPLSGAVDAAAAHESLRGEVERMYEALPPAQRARFADRSLREMQHELVESLARAAARAGETAESVRLARLAVRRRPWSPAARLLLAQALAAAGQSDAAITAVEEALELDPSLAEAQRLREALQSEAPFSSGL